MLPRVGRVELLHGHRARARRGRVGGARARPPRRVVRSRPRADARWCGRSGATDGARESHVMDKSTLVVRPPRPCRDRHRRDAGDRAGRRRGIRVRRRQGRGREPQGRRVRRDRSAPARPGRRGARRRRRTWASSTMVSASRRRDRRAVRWRRHRREQRGQRADATARPVHRRGVAEVVRREPARSRVPGPGRAAVTSSAASTRRSST